MQTTPQPFIAWHADFKHALPEGHRFPMIKYELLHDQLLYEGLVSPDDFFAPEPLDKKYLKNVHSPEYLKRLFGLQLDRQEVRRIGFPLSDQLLIRELRIAQGTVTGAVKALEQGLSFNIAGGTHHAGYDWGEGFCMLNDQAIAAHYLIHELGLKQILIIDLDVHQGNGTADIFKNEPQVFTFSMHGAKNFPFKKEPSDWDIGLPDGIQGADYLQILAEALEKLPQKVHPDFVFFQSGVDVLATDRMGRLKLSPDDCRQRDVLVFDFCKQRSLPLQVSMGGGYSKEIRKIVDAHANTYREGINHLLKRG